MPHYTSHHRTGSGVPLGGLGAGKVEIMPDGCLTNFTHQNNWDRPLGDPSGLNAVDARVGNHFAVWARRRCADGGDRDTAFARMLHTVDVGGLPGVQRIEYTGRYPFAHLVYVEPGLPVEVQLDAFSPIIPGDAESSSVPVAVFLFKVKNTCQAGWVDAAIMAMARNTVSAWNVGRFNEAVSSGEARGVLFSSDSPLPTDPAAGTVCLATCAGAGEVTVCTSWNLKTADPFNLTLANQNIEPWQEFARDGRITPRDCGTVQGEGVELAGALAVRFELAPGETKHVPVVLAWHMPQTHFGHVYEARYADAAEVAADVLRSWEELRTRALKWSEALEVAKGEAAERGRVGDALPDWLADALLNNLYVLSSGSWFDRSGRFALFEASRTCQLMNTVDVLFYSSVPLAWFYPALEESCLLQLAQAQRPDGYIPHDLGRGRVDYPSDGTTAPPPWKDLCPKFVLMAYRDVLWWGGRRLLSEVYDPAKRAMLWAMASDLNGDHLPDNEGADQTFDNWHFRGANAYTSGVYLAALAASQRLAEMAEDSDFARTCRREFQLAQESFERQLWNGRYYRAVASTGGGVQVGGAGSPSSEACTASQLTGQWYAHLLGLGYILPREQVSSAVREAVRITGSASAHGAVNAVLPNGSIDWNNPHSGNVWPGITYTLAALAIYEGLVGEGLELARRVWESIAHRSRNPWDQPDVIDSATGAYGFGDHYMRNMVVWAVVFALAARDAGVAKVLGRLRGGVVTG